MHKFLLVLLALVWAVPAQGQKSVPAWPVGLDTARYPIYHKVEAMSAIRIAELGLRPVKLDTAIVVWNWTEARKRFLPDTLQKGVIVAVDSAGVPTYKVDCSNRLALFSPPRIVVLPPDTSVNQLVNNETERSGFWSLLRDAFSAAGKFLLALLMALLILAVIAAVLWFLWGLGNVLFGSRPTETRRDTADEPGDDPNQIRRGAAEVPVATTGDPSATTRRATPDRSHPSPAVAPSATVPASAPSPTPAPTHEGASTRRFIALFPGGDEGMIKYQGVRNVRWEEEDGVTTVRFENAQ